ncbi:2Fe-2S iron-sulfur cluster-binding protein [Pseudomonas sp. GNP013]
MSQFFALTLAHVRRDTPDSMVLTLNVPHEHRARFAHRAGQHLTLRAWVDGQELRRSYSLCNVQGDGSPQLAIKRIADGQFSQWAHRHLQAGAVIEAMPPTGSFGLESPCGAPRHHVAFAAGSGITPILSILETALRDEPTSRFTLVYGNRDLASVQFRERLCQLKNTYLTRLSIFHFFSNEPQDVELFSGRLDERRCGSLLTSCVQVSTIDHVYLCGPAAMMKGVSSALLAKGFPAGRIRQERFGTDPAVRPPSSVTVSASGVQLTVRIDGATRRLRLASGTSSLLDSMLAAGLAPPYSCKAGVCGTCRCKVLEGEVQMQSPHALGPSEVAQGYVLACMSSVQSPTLELAFD